MTYRLDKLVEIQHRTDSQSDFAYTSEKWVKYRRSWAWINPVRQDERVAGQQAVAISTHKAVIRYVKGVDTTMRLAMKDRTFEIGGVVDIDERGDYLQLDLTEIKENG